MGKKNLKAQLHYAVQSAFKGNSQQNGGFGASKPITAKQDIKVDNCKDITADVFPRSDDGLPF